MTTITAMDPRRRGRVRWMVRAALAVGVAASVMANVLHAQPGPVAQGIAAWPPLALLLTVELVGRSRSADASSASCGSSPPG